jgi:hypothetical protein
MSMDQNYEESLKAVHHAEEAVYKAQASSNMEQRQVAFQQLLVTKEKVNEAAKQNRSIEEQHRLHQAQEQLRHLSEAHQALED